MIRKFLSVSIVFLLGWFSFANAQEICVTAGCGGQPTQDINIAVILAKSTGTPHH